MASKKTLQRNELINAEIARLDEIFANIPEKVKNTVSSLIKNAAFMSVTLDELQEKINARGPVSKYQNGANQFGTKKSPEVEIYNTMVKNHAAVIKQLTELIPESDKKPREPDEFEKLARRDKA
jgi:hypothetical protein